MTSDRIQPTDCKTMSEVRQAIDWLDAEIVALIAERFRYMDAAARIKPDRAVVRDEARKAQVIEHVRTIAAPQGLDPDMIESLYELLIERSIAYELEQFDKAKASAGAG